MKKIITLSLMLGLIAATVQAQDFDDIFKKYKNENNITRIKINKLGCKLISLFAGNDADEGVQFLKKTSGLRIIVNENTGNESLHKDIQDYISKSKPRIIDECF